MSGWLIVLAVGVRNVRRPGVVHRRSRSRGAAPTAYVERSLEYGAAVFATLVVPVVLLRETSVDVGVSSNPRFLAALLAGLAAWRIENVASVVVVGMGALWLLRAIG